MAKVHIRSRRETDTLLLDFYYQGIRCREQTALPDTKENRKRLEGLAARIAREIHKGTFNYAQAFPSSPLAARFMQVHVVQGMTPHGTDGMTTNSLVAPTTLASNASIPSTPTFAEFSLVWRAEMEPQWRILHARSVDAIFEAHLLPTFGERTVASITKADVLAFRAELSKRAGRGGKCLAPSTVNKVFGLLRQCLTEACDRYDLADPFKGVKRMKSRRTDVEPFSLEEVEKIRNAIRSDWREYVTVRFFTGMRTGEINGLKWKYVDFEHHLISIRETYSSGMALEGAKTETSIRDIPMLAQVEEALRQRWEDRHPDSEYVFCNREGQPVDAHNFCTRIWYPVLRLLGLTRRRPYQTRHTTATLMLASGENPEWIARLMGHANTQMLFTVYSRFVPNLTRQDGRAFTGLINSHLDQVNEAPMGTADMESTNDTGDNSVVDLSNLTRSQLEALIRSLATSSQENRHDHV